MQGEAEPAFMVCGTIFLKAIEWGFFLEIWRIEINFCWRFPVILETQNSSMVRPQTHRQVWILLTEHGKMHPRIMECITQSKMQPRIIESIIDRHFLLSDVVMNCDGREKSCKRGLQASSEQFCVARFLLGLASFRQRHSVVNQLRPKSKFPNCYKLHNNWGAI
jgi:hypothetical protein